MFEWIALLTFCELFKVKYTADGFVEKNMDTLSNELKELGENSTKEVPRSVYEVNQVDGSSPTQRSSIRGIR